MANQVIAWCVALVLAMVLLAKVAEAQHQDGFAEGYKFGWVANERVQ